MNVADIIIIIIISILFQIKQLNLCGLRCDIIIAKKCVASKNTLKCRKDVRP